MPRSSPPPQTPDATQAPADAGASSSPAAHRYTAPYTVTYPHVPLTCREGDVWAWPDGDAPDDGRWEPTGLPVNTRPDNEPKPEPEGAADHVEEG